MDHRKSTLIAAALLFSGSSHAFFVTAATPAGWVAGAGGAATQAAASVQSWIATSEGIAAARVSSAVNVAGRTVSLPALLRLAPTASRVAAAAAFGNPVTMLVAATALAYYMQSDYFIDPVDTIWKKRVNVEVCATNCFEYAVPASVPQWSRTQGGACTAYLAYGPNWANGAIPVRGGTVVNGQCTYEIGYYIGTGRAYWEARVSSITSRPIPPYDNSYTVPATEQEFITEFEPKKLTPEVITAWPQELPLVLPVEKPILNPSPLPETLPQPLRVPQSNPVEVTPATNPKTYTIPVIDINPANTNAQPWQVDIVTKTITSTSAEPLPETAPVPVTPTPNPDGSTPTETPTEKQPDLCDLYPDILACAKPELDTPKEDKINEQKVNVAITPDGGWGSGGSCPAPRHINGANVDFEFTGICDFMTGIRPVVLAFAWLAAAMILIGVRSNGGD